MKRAIALRFSVLVLASLQALASPCWAGPATNISSVGVYAVHSDKSQAWTYPKPGQYSTQGEGGAWVVVCTAEVGYGTPQACTINGIPGTQLTQLLTPMVQNGYIVGYYRYWLFQGGNVNGEFVYTVRSINSGQAKTTWIYIW